MRMIIAALAAIFVTGSAAAAPSPSDSALERAADEALKSTQVPGLAVLEIRDGKIMPEVVRGVRSTDRRDPVKPGDVWHLGSNAKPIVTTLIAMLVERGKLRWDSRLADLLPELAPTIDPAFRDATVLDLASHRSGLSENTDVPFIEGFFGDKRPLPEQRLAYLRRALAEKPAVPRGSYQYSNTAFIALGAIAERAAGAPVEMLLRREIFRPLHMRSAAFGPTARGEPLGHEAGKPQLGERADNPAFWTTAGAIRMSMKDWALWSIDQIEGERGHGRLMSAASYRFLHTAQFTPPGRTTAVAVDWGVKEQPYGRLLTHTGSNGYWYAIIALAPDIRSGVLVAANAAEDMGGDKAVLPPFKVVTKAWEWRVPVHR